ncbi:MAG: hypothetical protein IPP52_10640 [Ignavibacteria bacterium]|nr:hypothetical protein [Ignavibacteria bacterium]
MRNGFINQGVPSAHERPEEFAPGLDKELQEMADALTEFKTKLTKNGSAMNGKKKLIRIRIKDLSFSPNCTKIY